MNHNPWDYSYNWCMVNLLNQQSFYAITLFIIVKLVRGDQRFSEVYCTVIHYMYA